MKCINHPNSIGHYVCDKCGNLVCVECAVTLDDVRTACRSCVAAAVGTKPTKRNMRVNLLQVLIWGFLPGLSHMSMGLMKRGLFFCATFFLAIYASSEFIPMIALAIPIIFFYSFFDALSLRRLINSGEVVIDAFPSLPDLRTQIVDHPILSTILIFLILARLIHLNIGPIIVVLLIVFAIFSIKKRNSSKNDN